MNSEVFIKSIQKCVRNSSISGTISTLKNPPGRSPHKNLKEISCWYNQLSDNERNIIKQIIEQAVDSSLFGFLCVIDGVRTIEDSYEKGQFKLIYENENGIELVNSPEEEYLHDTFKELLQE